MTKEHLNPVREIYNIAIAKTDAIMHYEPRTELQMKDWLLNRSTKYPVIVATSENGEVIGFATLSQWSPLVGYDDSAELSLYVKEGYRGKGIGNKLIQSVLEIGQQNNIYTVFSRITSGNTGSIALHEKFGFLLAGTLNELGMKFGKRLDIHYYQKIFK